MTDSPPDGEMHRLADKANVRAFTAVVFRDLGLDTTGTRGKDRSVRSINIDACATVRPAFIVAARVGSDPIAGGDASLPVPSGTPPGHHFQGGGSPAAYNAIESGF